ncbi:MAG: DUF3784 domain-containing protein [Actinomycetota bacterium]
MWFSFGMATLLLVIGLLVHAFKMHFLISGYNTMSKAKREKVDVRKVARIIGLWSYANAAVFTVVGFLLALEVQVPIEAPLVFFGVTTLVLLFRAQKYDGNIFDENGNLRPGAGRELALAGAVMGALVIGIILLLFLLSRPLEITASDDGVEIPGLYGTTLAWDTITEVELLEELPRIEIRTNGSAVGSQLRGHFRTAGYGPVRLFVDSDAPPFILTESDGDIVIMNLGSAAETEGLFEQIEDALAERTAAPQG